MITVLTPTYNRLHTLPRLYESLCTQTAGGFEWLVIDDGSSDGTLSWLRSRPSENFDLRWERQENGGKHVAINTGVALAHGDWIFIVDSDDLLTPKAIQLVSDAIRAAEQSPQVVAGVCFRRATLDGRKIGRECSELPVPWTSTPTEAAHQVSGDLAYIFRRRAMEETSFPVIPGEKFVPELYIWNQIGDKGQIWFYLNKVVYLCEYLEDGYSHNFRTYLRRNPGGFLLHYAAQIGREESWMGRIKAIIRSLQCIVYCAASASSRHGRKP